MITYRSKQALFVLLAFGLFIQSCAFAGAGQSSPEPVKLKVVLLPFLSFAPFFIADAEGYFAEQGLEIEFVEMNRPAEALPALAQGELDVAGGFITVGLLNSIEKGANVKIVADKGYISDTDCANGLMARRDLVDAGELESPAQLQGRRIDIVPASMENYYLEKLLNQAGLTIDDLELEDIPTTAALDALEQGTIDLTAAAEPWVTRMSQTDYAVTWLLAREVIPDFQFAAIFYGPSLLEENPEAGERFMVAYLKAVQQYNQGKTERNLEILAERTGLDRELLNQICWPALRDNGQINAQSVLDFQSWAVEKGLLDSPVTAVQFWGSNFVEHANQVLNE